MKFYLLPALMMVYTYGVAQEPALTNDLNTGIAKIEYKYKPNFRLGPEEFNEITDQARKDAYEQIKSRNKEETILKHLDVDYYLRNYLSSYLMMLKDRGMTDSQEKYVDSLIYSNADPNNEVLYRRSFAYRQWVGSYLSRMYQTKYPLDTSFKHVQYYFPIDVVLGEIQNPFIREYECYRVAGIDLRFTKDTTLARRIFDDFNAVVTNSTYRNTFQQQYDNYKRIYIPGGPAPDFSYADVNGKPITLSNLRGKYVYIDIWSTYCPHCIEEFPSLAKIEEEYKDKNIQFVSLSLDDQSWKDRWRNYVIDHKLPGYQVIADKSFESDFINKLNIVAIPRFILIDPAGNIVDGDAKRPSDLVLKKQFDQLLK